MKSLFKITLDTKVSETPCKTGFDIRPLLEHFGQDVTWRTIIAADRQEMYSIKGYARETVNRIYAFTSDNIEYTFSDYLNSVSL